MTTGKKVKFELDGFFSVTSPDSESLRPAGRKSAGILAFLAYHHGRKKTRGRLIELFWADRGQEQAQASLRQALHAIRVALGEHVDSVISIGRDSVAVNPENSEFDLWNDDGSVNLGIGGTVLEDLDYISPKFDDWLRDTRRNITRRQISRAERLLFGIDLDECWEEALRLSNKILSLDPTNEPVARIAMSVYYNQDLLGKMRDVFEQVREHLRADDLDVSEKTLALYDSFHQSDANEPESTPRGIRATTDQASGPEGAIPIVEVVSIRSHNGSADGTELFEDFFDRMISRMIQMPELHVKTGQGKVSGDRASEYQLLVSPGLWRSGLKVGLRLISSDGESLWSERADLPLDSEDNYVQVQVDSMVTQLLPILEENIFRGISGEPTTAYGHYLLSKRYFVTAPPGDYMEKVVDHLHRATELDPEFLPAYTNLIMSYNTGMFMSRPGSDHTELREKAYKIAQRLLHLNSKYANSHISLGWCLLWKGKFDSAERSIRRAMDLRPYEPHRLNVLATALVYLGHHDEAEIYYEMAQQRLVHDLDFQRTDYGELYYLKGEFERALSWLETPEFRSPYRTLFWRAPTYAQLGKLTEAREDVEAMVEDIEGRWCGPKPFRPENGIQWYCDMKPLRREEDRKLLVDGFAKAGIEVFVRRLP